MSQSHPILAAKSPEPPEASASGAGPSPLQTLHCLLHSIALPKTQKAKTCSIALETLLEARKLVSIACATVQHPTHSPNPSPSPSLSTIIQKLDEISAHIKPKQPVTQTYASVLASKATSPASPTPLLPPLKPSNRRNTKFDITLAQNDRRAPVFMDLTDIQLADKIREAIVAGECTFVSGGPSSDDGSSDVGINYEVRVRAAGRHRSGDIWIAVHSKAEHVALTETAYLWLPWLSDKLHVAPTTYPIIVHGIPTSFDPSRDSDDITAFLEENHRLFDHPSALQHAEFISRALDHSRSKAHSSLILYLTDPRAANACITQHIAFRGQLHATARFHRHPPQCYNCLCFGHFARSCKSSAVCACCAGAHATRACKCPLTDPCREAAPCCHIKQICALCSGTHTATDRDCPTRRSLIERHLSEHPASGPLFPTT